MAEHMEVKTPSHETLEPDQITDSVANESVKKVDPEYVAIKVKNQYGKIIFYQLRRGQILKKLLLSYCNKYSVDYPAARFLIDGQLFNHNKTPDQMELDDETEIEVMIESLGGGGGEQSFAWTSAN